MRAVGAPVHSEKEVGSVLRFKLMHTTDCLQHREEKVGGSSADQSGRSTGRIGRHHQSHIAMNGAPPPPATGRALGRTMAAIAFCPFPHSTQVNPTRFYSAWVEANLDRVHREASLLTQPRTRDSYCLYGAALVVPKTMHPNRRLRPCLMLSAAGKPLRLLQCSSP